MPTTNRVRLTERMIEQAMRNPPAEGQTTFLRDSVVPGLAVRVHPTGLATYTLLLPKGQRMKLWPVMRGKELKEQLKIARKYAAKQLDEAYQGRDPREQKNREKKEQEEQRRTKEERTRCFPTRRRAGDCRVHPSSPARAHKLPAFMRQRHTVSAPRVACMEGKGHPQPHQRGGGDFG